MRDRTIRQKPKVATVFVMGVGKQGLQNSDGYRVVLNCSQVRKENSKKDNRQ